MARPEHLLRHRELAMIPVCVRTDGKGVPSASSGLNGSNWGLGSWAYVSAILLRRPSVVHLSSSFLSSGLQAHLRHGESSLSHRTIKAPSADGLQC